MPSALSTDPRERTVASVEEGASRHDAAVRFGVSAVSVSRSLGRFARDGDAAAKSQGGDRRSRETEAHAAVIPTPYEANPEIFPPELCSVLVEHGVRTSIGALSRFFARHAITPEK